MPEPPGLPALPEPSNSRTHWGITFYHKSPRQEVALVSADKPHVSPCCPGRWQCVGVSEPPGLPALLESSNSHTHWDITFHRRPLHLGVAPVPVDKPHVSPRCPGRWRRIKVPKPPEPVPHYWEGWGAVSRRNRGGRTYTASWRGLCGSPESLEPIPRRRRAGTLPGGAGSAVSRFLIKDYLYI